MNNAEWNTLSNLIDEYWKDYWSYKNSNIVVTPSIPIIWFGNIDAYLSIPKEKRVLTVAINPSNREFSKTGTAPFSLELRFGQNVNKLVNLKSLNNKDKNVLINAYNQYFTYNSYEFFFKLGFERVLQNLPGSLKVSYGYNNADITAIHIDCKTALATTELWSSVKTPPCNEKLYKSLLSFLDPSVVLISDAQFKEETLDKEGARLNERIISSDKASYERISYEYEERLWIYGKNSQRPFFLPTTKNKNASNEEKQFLEDAFRLFGIKF